MMSSAFNSGDAASRREPQAETLADDNSANALDRVLDHTLFSAAGGALAGSDDLSMYQSVAQTHRGQPFSFDPVAVDLVLAALARQFEPQGLPQTTLRTAAKSIAATLCDDPYLRERLERLWQRLSERQS